MFVINVCGCGAGEHGEEHILLSVSVYYSFSSVEWQLRWTCLH